MAVAAVLTTVVVLGITVPISMTVAVVIRRSPSIGFGSFM